MEGGGGDRTSLGGSRGPSLAVFIVLASRSWTDNAQSTTKSHIRVKRKSSNHNIMADSLNV